MQTNAHIQKVPSYAGQYRDVQPWAPTLDLDLTREATRRRCPCGATYHRRHGDRCPMCQSINRQAEAARLGGGEGADR